MPHHCHAKGCDLAVPPKLLMCRRHWAMVPPALRTRVWDTYKPGQERTKDVSPEWIEAADAAIAAVAKKEGKA